MTSDHAHMGLKPVFDIGRLHVKALFAEHIMAAATSPQYFVGRVNAAQDLADSGAGCFVDVAESDTWSGHETELRGRGHLIR